MSKPARSPRNATHAHNFNSYNAEQFFWRCGRRVYEFSLGRHQWFLTKHKPEILSKCKPLNVFEMHPDTARELLTRRGMYEQR